MRPATFLPILLTCACAPAPVSMPVTTGACPIRDSSNWAAWVDAMPGTGRRPTLIVTGKAIVPSGGFTISWGEPLVMESYPVQVSVDLRPIRAAGMHTQALVTKEVRGEWPMREPVGAVTITCGSKVLARIAPVETAR